MYQTDFYSSFMSFLGLVGETCSQKKPVVKRVKRANKANGRALVIPIGMYLIHDYIITLPRSLLVFVKCVRDCIDLNVLLSNIH